MSDREFEFWWDRLNIPAGGYNQAVDEQIYGAAKLLVKARKKGSGIYCDELAEALKISKEHAELIQYILASVDMPRPAGALDCAMPFDYGTSPRGLFVCDLDMAEKFLAEFERYLDRWNGE